jgi:predicted nucleic acid-binding protein
MRILVDSNVPLDVILKRQIFYETAVKILGLRKGGIELFVSASAFTDIYYIVRKARGKDAALRAVEGLLQWVDAAAVTGDEIRRAVGLAWGDFEDAVQYAAGERLFVDYIVTRNKSDFVSAAIPVLMPEEMLDLLTGTSPS